MDRKDGERAHHPGWSVVVAGYVGALTRAVAFVRPGVWLAAVACLYLVRMLPTAVNVPLPARTLDGLALPDSFPMTVPALTTPLLTFGLILSLFCWWLPRGQWAAVWLVAALLVCLVTLVPSEPLTAVCCLAVALAVLVAPAAESKRGGLPLYAGMMLLGVVALVISAAAVRSIVPGSVGGERDLALATTAVGLALILGLAPFPFWLPAVSERGQAAGAALLATLVPVCALRCGLALWTGLDVPAGWLPSEPQTVVIVGVSAVTVLVAGSLALWQRNLRRALGFLLVAHLGLLVADVGVGLGQGVVEGTLTVALVQMVNRGLAVLVLFPCLSFLAAVHQRWTRLLLIAISAMGLWLLFGDVSGVTASDRQGLLATVLLAGRALALAGCVGMLARSWWPVADSFVPDDQARTTALGPALGLMVAVVAFSLAVELRPEAVQGWAQEIVLLWLSAE